MENLKKRLRIVLTSKRLVLIIAIGSMLVTMLFVRVVKNWVSSDSEDVDVFFEKAMDGKKAVSLLVKSSSLPIELLYPGVKVDVINKNDDGVSYIVRDVYVVGISVMDEGQNAKVTLAVNKDESEKVLSIKGDNVSLLVRGNNSKESDDIEIVEM